MANIFLPKKSSVAGKVPLASDLAVGELAINLTDKKIYSKDAGGNVISIGSGASGGTVTLAVLLHNSSTTNIFITSNQFPILMRDGVTSNLVTLI